MDPVSQGVLGGVASQSAVKNRADFWWASFVGILSGMAADLDVLIRSDSDPMLYFELHRHFTHSLIFIPFGALIMSVLFYFFFRKRRPFKKIYFFSLLGYATHALLDSCTSYGTLLFWPFSNERVAWNNVSIIDPLFTIPLLVLMLLAAFRKKRVFAWIGVFWAILYLGLGLIQAKRVESFVLSHATSRGHLPERLTVAPTLGNILLWHSLYEHEGRYYWDGVRMAGSGRLHKGGSRAVLELSRDFPDLDPTSTLAKDVERFRWFARDYLSLHPQRDDVIVDMRYTALPDQLLPLWGIEVKESQQTQPTKILFFRSDRKKHLGRFRRLLLGTDMP